MQRLGTSPEPSPKPPAKTRAKPTPRPTPVERKPSKPKPGLLDRIIAIAEPKTKRKLFGAKFEAQAKAAEEERARAAALQAKADERNAKRRAAYAQKKAEAAAKRAQLDRRNARRRERAPELNAAARAKRAAARAAKEQADAKRRGRNAKAIAVRDKRRQERGLPPVEPRKKASVRSWSQRPKTIGEGDRMEVFERGRNKDGSSKYVALIEWTDKTGKRHTGYFRLPKDLSTDDVLDVLDGIRNDGAQGELRDTDPDAAQNDYQDEEFEQGIPWDVQYSESADSDDGDDE